MALTINPAHQAFILARLSEFCDYHARVRKYESDPWSYMREKILQLEPSMTSLKEELLAATRQRVRDELKAGGITEERFSDLKALLEPLLTRGDFADVAFHLSTAAGPGSSAAVEALLRQARANHVFLEERREPSQRTPSWEKLVGEIYRRLDLDALGALLARKPTRAKRRAAALRVMRRNVAEYCSVVRIPTSPDQTFTPFMLPRIEALIGASLRFLNKHR